MNNIETNDNSKNIIVRLSRKIKLRKEINHIDNNKTGYYTRRPMKNTTYETVTKEYTNLLRTNTENMFINTKHAHEGNIPHNDVRKYMGLQKCNNVIKSSDGIARRKNIQSTFNKNKI